MSECEKRGCGYYWQDETLPYFYCHYNDPVFPPPCADEDYYYYDYNDDVDESNYDPYAGCDMYECSDAADF